MNDKKKKDKNDQRNSNKRERADSQNIINKEVGGPAGPEPTRYGDWEKKGRCIDF